MGEGSLRESNDNLRGFRNLVVILGIRGEIFDEWIYDNLMLKVNIFNSFFLDERYLSFLGFNYDFFSRFYSGCYVRYCYFYVSWVG